MPWQRCPCCGAAKHVNAELCTDCWNAAPAAARRAHYKILGLFEKGRIYVDRVGESRRALAQASREARYGLSLFAILMLAGVASCDGKPAAPCIKAQLCTDSLKAKDSTPSKPDSAAKALPRDTGARAGPERE